MTPTATARTWYQWRPKPGMIPMFIVGLIVGPVALSYFGITVTSRTARAEHQGQIVALQASVCEARARAENPNAAKLDANARRDLATKHAAKQPNGIEDNEIISACSGKLAG